MRKKHFNIIGWIILVGIGAWWIWFGYSSWYILLLPLAYISFSINDSSIKKLRKIKGMSLQQVILILFAFVASVGIVFGLIQLANLINDQLHLTGGIKTFGEIIAVILSLYPVKFTFGSIVYKVTSDLNAKSGRFL